MRTGDFTHDPDGWTGQPFTVAGNIDQWNVSAGIGLATAGIYFGFAPVFYDVTDRNFHQKYVKLAEFRYELSENGL